MIFLEKENRIPGERSSMVFSSQRRRHRRSFRFPELPGSRRRRIGRSSTRRVYSFRFSSRNRAEDEETEMLHAVAPN